VRIDRRETARERPEPALARIAPRGVNDDEPSADALFLHHIQHRFNAKPLTPHVGFLPDRGIDRDHVALTADLNAIPSEE
jgi:hypothetical protein